MAFALAAATFAVGTASAIATYQGQTQAAAKGKRAQADQRALDLQFRRDVQEYQNEVWEQDLAFAQETLAYSQGEFDRQVQWAGTAADNLQKNRDNDAYVLAIRGIEETIARTLQGTSIAREGQAARATFRAKERGVEGNSVEAVLQDVRRQEGNAETFLDMNLSATRRQLNREGVAMDAQADQQLYQLANGLRSFAPNAPIRAPGPDPQVRPAQSANGPSIGSLGAGIFNAATSAANTYSSLSGQNGKQIMDNLSSWASRQFTISAPVSGGSAEP